MKAFLNNVKLQVALGIALFIVALVMNPDATGWSDTNSVGKLCIVVIMAILAYWFVRGLLKPLFDWIVDFWI